MLNFVLLIWSKLRGQFINVEVWRRFCWLLFWEKSLKHIKSSHAAFTCPLLDVRTQCVKIERQLWPSQPQSILWAYGDTRVLTRQNYTCSGSTHTSMTTRPTLFSVKRWWYLQPKRARLRPSPHHPKGLTHGEFLDRASAASEQAQKGATVHDCATGQRSSLLLGGLDMNVSLCSAKEEEKVPGSNQWKPFSVGPSLTNE